LPLMIQMVKGTCPNGYIIKKFRYKV
jgi:hypothetical protein